MYVLIIFVTINIITDSFILKLALLIGLRKHMLFQRFYREFLFLKLQNCRVVCCHFFYFPCDFFIIRLCVDKILY